MRLTYALSAAVFLLSFLQQSAFSSTHKKAESDIYASWNDFSFSIEDSRCFVGVSPVYLTVTELRPEEGNLVGSYEIRVPLNSSKNDSGQIVFPINTCVKDLKYNGGIIEGKAYSSQSEGFISDIVCKIIPEKNQTIKMQITTDDRTVKFRSHYSLEENFVPDSGS